MRVGGEIVVKKDEHTGNLGLNRILNRTGSSDGCVACLIVKNVK